MTNTDQAMDIDQRIAALHKTLKGSIMTKNRFKVVRSHLAQTKYFINYDQAEFDNWVIRKYIEAGNRNKGISMSYLVTVGETIKRYEPMATFNPNSVKTTIRKLQKVTNPLNRETLMNKDGQPIEGKMLNTKYVGTRVQSVYSDKEIGILVNYYYSHLMSFIERQERLQTQDMEQQISTVPTADVELALMMVLLFGSWKRFSEIHRLTLGDADGLITSGTVNIKSKAGTRILPLIIPNQLSALLNRYILACGLNVSTLPGETHLFHHSYKVLYDKCNAQHRILFNKRNGRPFHALRNYFCHKYLKEDNDSVQTALGHETKKMTKMYSNVQKKAMKGHFTRDFLSEKFDNLIQREASDNTI